MGVLLMKGNADDAHFIRSCWRREIIYLLSDCEE